MENHETHQERKQPRRMEVWFARLPERGDSSVQSGNRPVLVLSNDINNAMSSVLTVLPMTSKPKRLELPSHTWVDADRFEGLRTGALILAEQITAIDQKQLVFRIGVCKDEETIRKIEASVNGHLGLDGKEKSMNSTNMNPAKTKQDYLNSLPHWDGKKRIDTMLIDYLGARDSAYVREVGRNMMITAVTRALDEDSCSAIAPMFVGPAACGKSSFVRKLGSGYSETVEMVKGKTPRMLAKNLLVEVCGMDRSVVEMIHRAEPFLPVLTSNTLPENFAGRRICPVHVGIQDTGRAFTVEQDEVDQLWAEAVAAYRNGEKPYVGTRDTEGRAAEEKPIPKKYPYGIG
jgi:mRNA-degrading endonuclease toxin of MazEF toxin-antitoxin module